MFRIWTSVSFLERKLYGGGGCCVGGDDDDDDNSNIILTVGHGDGQNWMLLQLTCRSIQKGFNSVDRKSGILVIYSLLVN